jgi:hypothetical protein
MAHAAAPLPGLAQTTRCGPDRLAIESLYRPSDSYRDSYGNEN